MGHNRQASATPPGLRQILGDTARLLCFRRTSPGLHTHWRHYLGFGLLCSWLAGVGRYWDNPRAELWQILGLGSLAYVVALALLLWLLLWPLRPQRWSYRNLLVFITLTSPPALLYAIPVERFWSHDTAAMANLIFLAVVASWRVALLVVFLRRVAGFGLPSVIVGTLLPLCVIVIALAALNLEHVVFNIMSGIRPEQRSVNDFAYQLVFLLSWLSILAAPILFLAHLGLMARAWSDRAARRDAF